MIEEHVEEFVCPHRKVNHEVREGVHRALQLVRFALGLLVLLNLKQIVAFRRNVRSVVPFAAVVRGGEYGRHRCLFLLTEQIVLLVAKSDALVRTHYPLKTLSLHDVRHRLLSEVDAAGALRIQRKVHAPRFLVLHGIRP